MRTDTTRIPVIDGEVVVTSEIPAPWLRPPVTATYRTPHARVRRLAARIRRSEFGRDVAARLPRILEVLGAVGIGFGLVIFIRGAYVAAELVGLAGR